MIIFPKECEVEHNKYYKWYCNIIERRINSEPSGYCEKHHIIPKCCHMSSDNIVKLTAREHFIVHMLLPRFIGDKNIKKRLIYASWGISNQNGPNQCRIRVNSRMYAIAKRQYSQSISGDNHWMKDEQRKKALSEKCKGRKFSKSTLAKISKRLKGSKKSPEWKKKIGDGNRGKVRSNETKEKISLALQDRYKNGMTNPMQGVKRPKEKCPYCGKTVDVANMKRWHGKNCKNHNN